MVDSEVKLEDNENKGVAAAEPTEPEHFRKLFIGGLTPNTTESDLRDFYGKYGTILECVLVREPETKKSRGFGFVTYSTKNEVDVAMDNRPHVIDDKTVDVKRAIPRGQVNVSTQRLYISGVREDHTEADFKNCFGEFGNVTKVEILTDKATGKPRGFAFVTFDDYDSVDRCVLVKSHTVRGYQCDVKKGLSREELERVQQQERDRSERGFRSRGGFRGGRGFGTPRGRGRGNGPAGNFREPHGNFGNIPAWPQPPQPPIVQQQWAQNSIPQQWQAQNAGQQPAWGGAPIPPAPITPTYGQLPAWGGAQGNAGDWKPSHPR